jgi:membrane-bound serine protease (ClpP class)
MGLVARPRSRYLVSVGVAATVLALGAGAAAAQDAAPPTRIEVLKVEGPIDRPLLGFVLDRLDAAERSGTIVVLQLDSPGALGEDGVALADRVASLSVPILTWVGPPPARASGAALLLLHASSLAAVAPGSQTGPLTPVELLDPDAGPPDLRARIAAWAAARGHQPSLDHLDEPLTAQRALDLGIAQLAATSVPDLLARADGLTVRTAEGEVTLRTRIATTQAQAREGTVALVFNEPGPIRRLQHAVATPSMVYWLLVAGLAALAFELTQPGFGFAGVSGVVLLSLAGYGATIVPPAPLGLGLLLLGTGALVLDVRLHRLGVLTGVGLVLFGLGSWLAWRDVAEAIRISWWLIAGATLAAFLYYGFVLTVAVRSRERIESTQRGLIGLVGQAGGPLAPDGPVLVKGVTWRGRAIGEPIAAGSRVRVRGVDGLVLRVEREPDEPED